MYEKTTWVDNLTPLNAANMNNIEEGVETLDEDVTELQELAVHPAEEYPLSKFLNGNKEWVEPTFNRATYAANLYFTAETSDVNGYKKIAYTNQLSSMSLTSGFTSGKTLLRTYLFDDALGIDTIDAGVWSVSYIAKVSAEAGEAYLEIDVFVRDEDDAETTLFTERSPNIENEEFATFFMKVLQPQFDVNSTDRLGVRLYGVTDRATTVVLTTSLGGADASYFNTPLALRHSLLRELNADDDYLHVTAEEKANIAESKTNTVTITASATDSLTLADKTEYFINGAQTFTFYEPTGAYNSHLFIYMGEGATINIPSNVTVYGDDVSEPSGGEMWEISAKRTPNDFPSGSAGTSLWVCINWGNQS